MRNEGSVPKIIWLNVSAPNVVGNTKFEYIGQEEEGQKYFV